MTLGEYLLMNVHETVGARVSISIRITRMSTT